MEISEVQTEQGIQFTSIYLHTQTKDLCIKTKQSAIWYSETNRICERVIQTFQ
jgi:hypothetical protein